jgi:hypothetical protein
MMTIGRRWFHQQSIPLSQQPIKTILTTLSSWPDDHLSTYWDALQRRTIRGVKMGEGKNVEATLPKTLVVGVFAPFVDENV